MNCYRTRTSRACFFVLALLSAITPALFSQNAPAGLLEGRVSHAATGAALANVRITVEGAGRDALTGPGGLFRLAGLPAGEWRVTANYVGLEPRTSTVRLEPGRGANLDFTLGGGDVVALQRFEVLEQREQSAQALALNQQRQSPNIKNVVARDEYPAGSDDNVADFLRFIPGVSIVYSGRAGTDASLRGLPSDTSGVTMDGVELSGAFTGNTRAVSLLAVPTSNIATVEVTKVPTPDLAANGLGGSINITTRSGFERTRPQFNYNVFTAFDPQYGLGLSSRKGPHPSMDAPSVRPSFEFGYTLPVNKSLSVSLSAANKLNYNTNPADGQMIWDLVQGFASVSVLRNSQVQIVTVRSGLLGVDWKIGDRNLFKATVSYRMRDA
ncbi:MAG: carboxypeptidase regulatory-like domain-containing protein, partial [Opitutaceae bacterium]